jgi:hypothetical protein
MQQHHQQRRRGRPTTTTAAAIDSPRRPLNSGRSMTAVLLLLVCGLLPALVEGFKYKIDDKYAETAKWSFTETYMYGSGKVSGGMDGGVIGW